VRLEIIATTYHSTIVKTHVFSLYSHLCIYVSIKLPIYTRWIWTGCSRCLSNSRRAWKWRSSELRDTLRGRDWASLEMHLEAEIDCICTDTWRPWSSELGDALQDSDWASFYMHLEAVIERVWRCTWRRWLCKLGGRNWTSLEMHFEAMIVPTWRL